MSMEQWNGLWSADSSATLAGKTVLAIVIAKDIDRFGTVDEVERD